MCRIKVEHAAQNTIKNGDTIKSGLGHLIYNYAIQLIKANRY